MTDLLVKIQIAIAHEVGCEEPNCSACRKAARAALSIAGPAIRERCAAYIDCGCPHGPEAVRAAKQYGHNSAQRWRTCGESICAALEAHEIRSMTDK